MKYSVYVQTTERQQLQKETAGAAESDPLKSQADDDEVLYKIDIPANRRA